MCRHVSTFSCLLIATRTTKIHFALNATKNTEAEGKCVCFCVWPKRCTCRSILCEAIAHGWTHISTPPMLWMSCYCTLVTTCDLTLKRIFVSTETKREETENENRYIIYKFKAASIVWRSVIRSIPSFHSQPSGIILTRLIISYVRFDSTLTHNWLWSRHSHI